MVPSTRFVLLIAFLVTTSVHCARNLYSDGVSNLFSGVESKEEFTGDVWALLIAGSAGWGNYRSDIVSLWCLSLIRQAQG